MSICVWPIKPELFRVRDALDALEQCEGKELHHAAVGLCEAIGKDWAQVNQVRHSRRKLGIATSAESRLDLATRLTDLGMKKGKERKGTGGGSWSGDKALKGTESWYHNPMMQQGSGVQELCRADKEEQQGRKVVVAAAAEGGGGGSGGSDAQQRVL